MNRVGTRYCWSALFSDNFGYFFSLSFCLRHYEKDSMETMRNKGRGKAWETQFSKFWFGYTVDQTIYYQKQRYYLNNLSFYFTFSIQNRSSQDDFQNLRTYLLLWGKNLQSSCEMFDVSSQGVGGGKYKHLQLVEKDSLEIMFVLGTDTKHQCKWWARQANKQTS